MSQHQRVTSEGESRLGIERLTNEFMNLPAGRPAAAGEAAVCSALLALVKAGLLQKTNFDQNR